MIVFIILILSVLSLTAGFNPSRKAPGLVYHSQYFYSPTVPHNMQPIFPEYDITSEELIPNQANPRIINQGGQFQPQLSSQGMEVVMQLADAMETLWYQPVVVLVDDSKDVYRDAELFMGNLMRMPQVKVSFLLMKFNSTGVSSIIADTHTSKEGFLNHLKWTKNQSSMDTSNTITPDVLTRGVVFYGLLKAATQLIPHSAIIIFTDRQVEDEDLVHLAFKELRDKNITLYVVWEGVFPTSHNGDSLLRRIAYYTKGEFLIGNTERNLSELYSNSYMINEGAKQAKNVIAFYANVTGYKEYRFPVDTDVKSIHIGVTSSVTAATLTSPDGVMINLLNNIDVANFSEGSFSTYETKLGQYEIQLNTAEFVPTSSVGMWYLDVNVSRRHAQGCNITVSIQTYLNVTTNIVYKSQDNNDSKLKKGNKVLRVVASGELTRIKTITVLDERGLPIEPNLNFTLPNKNKEPLIDSENFNYEHKHEADIDFKTLPKGPFYLRILGEDKNGKAFSRLSYYDTGKVNYLSQPLSVEVGAGSELFVQPHQYGKIFFEVTNNRDQVVYLYFMVQDEKSHLSRLEPRSSWVNPKQTIIVTVTTYASSAPTANYRNLVVFTVSGPEKVQKSAAMYVSSNKPNDDTDPRMWHRFTSDCTNILLGKCEDGSWVIEVTAEDRESGILQLTSSPKGLHFPNGYTSGTKEPVVGLYGGSCCNPKIQVTAIDLMNNRKSYTADAYKAGLSAGSISAIALGIILLLIIIIAIICVCKQKCCKERQSVDLPTYRGPQGSPHRY